MCVILHGQPEMACRGIAGPLQNVLSGPHQFNDSEREVRKVIGVCRLGPGQKFVQCFGIRLRRQLLTLPRGQLYDSVPSLRASDYAPDAGYLFLVKHTSNRAINSDHELFNEFRSSVLALAGDVEYFMIGNNGLHLDRIYVETTLTMPLAFERLGHLVLQLQLLLQTRGSRNLLGSSCPCLQPCSHSTIGQLRLVPDHCAVEVT